MADLNSSGTRIFLKKKTGKEWNSEAWMSAGTPAAKEKKAILGRSKRKEKRQGEEKRGENTYALGKKRGKGCLENEDIGKRKEEGGSYHSVAGERNP